MPEKLSLPPRPKVAFVTSHPIQYQVPVFRLLAADPELDFHVLFAQIPDETAQGAEFGVKFRWDLPLLEGYPYKVLKNVAREPSLMKFSGCDTPEIGNVLRQEKFDAVVVNGWVVKTCIQALWNCRRQGIPCIVRGEANLLRPRAAWKQWLQGLLVRRYSAYLYIGDENRRFYKYYGVADSRLFPARYCIENERFAALAEAADPVSCRSRWNIPATSTCYLFCGKFIDKKHPLELLRAFDQACKVRGDLHLLMVGDGALRAACEAYVREHGLPVTFTGFLNQKEIAAAYVASDCLVVPSDHGETWGLVVNEVMACGRPAIVSDQVGCRVDLIKESITGDWFRFGDWDRLADLLSQYSGNRERLATMGQDARRLIQKYGPDQAAAGVKSAVFSVLGIDRPVQSVQTAKRQQACI